MDTRITSPVPHAAIAPTRLDQAAIRGTVRTDLAPPVAVAAQVGAEQTRNRRENRPSPEQLGEKTTLSSFTADRETGELVFRVFDSNSETLLAQYPNESLLKLRAYIDAVDDRNARGG